MCRFCTRQLAKKKSTENTSMTTCEQSERFVQVHYFGLVLLALNKKTKKNLPQVYTFSSVWRKKNVGDGWLDFFLPALFPNETSNFSPDRPSHPISPQNSDSLPLRFDGCGGPPPAYARPARAGCAAALVPPSSNPTSNY